MYFDEVYHARTATEFLQHWEYGEPHAIYEYTHPHLAKYAMAWGIAPRRRQQVSGTADLGRPVADAAIERTLGAPADVAERNGDRLYVATGTRTCAPRPGAAGEQEARYRRARPTALAVDDDGHRLYVADQARQPLTLDTTVLDDRRERGSGDDAGTSPGPASTALSPAPGRRSSA